MSTEDEELGRQLDGITGAYLDQVQNGMAAPSLASFCERMAFVQIQRLARFWNIPEQQTPRLFEQSAEDFVTGLYGQYTAWMFLLKGSPKQIAPWFGIVRQTQDQSALESVLRGAFPDVRFGESVVLNRALTDHLHHALILTGTPGSKTDGRMAAGDADQIEKVCRGLYGSTWVYAVHAVPFVVTEIRKAIRGIMLQIRETQHDYLLERDPTKQNRLAQQLLQALEAKLKRYEQGRVSGMWQTHIMLFLEDAALTGRAQALLSSAFSGEEATPEPIRVFRCQQSGTAKPPVTLLNSRELAILTRLPREEYPGYEVVDYARFGVEPGNTVKDRTKSILIGDIYDRGMPTETQLALALPDVTKHGLIVGVTGSGKTNTCFWLLRQLWHEQHIHFLVIESAKSEYRSLLNMRSASGVFLFNDLKVFTVGRETVSPLRLNPFEVPPGIAVQTHLDYLKSLFSAAFVLYPPMPYVLEQSLQEVYEDRGWNLALNTNRRVQTAPNGRSDAEPLHPRMFPTLSDLIAKVEVVIQRMQYDKEITMNVRAGLIARLNQLRIGGGKGLMFNTRQSIPTEILFNSPCLLELKQLVSDDEKAFLIGLLLIRLYEYYEGNPQYRPQLRHVTLIEEAHRLLRNVSTEQGSEVSANPKGRAIEVFANILSEIRAYGEGILIAEQIPTKLTPDAIKNTNLKIVHRLVAEDDRKVVGSTMNLTDSQTRYLTTLEKGEGIAYTEGMRKPVLLKVPPAKSDEAVTDDVVRTRMSRMRNELEDIFRRFTGCAYCPRGVKPWECPYKGNEEFDAALKESFLRLFNALRLNKVFVFEAYRDFLAQYQRLPARDADPRAIYCVFAELVEPELERRGEFGQWLYPEVDKVIHLACEILAIMVSNDGALQRKEFEKLYWDKLIAFSNQLKGLHKTDILPYPGCQSCAETERCLYRFDMAFLDDDGINSEDFQTYLTQEEIEQAVNVCGYVGRKRFLPKDSLSSCGAALCFAVQQLNVLGVTTFAQQEWAAEIKNVIQHTIKEAQYHGTT